MRESTSSSTENSKGYLLDTHVFIWWMEKNKRLSKNLYQILNNPQNPIFLSVASIWEIVLKKGKSKIKTPRDIESNIKSRGFIILPIEAQHVFSIEKLPHYHADPFDRILVAQSKVENLTLISGDQKIWKYEIDILKC